jgi:hypothetical protein
MKELWVEAYRPKTVDGYVFRDDHQRKQVETWVKDKSIPHLLLSGSAGIGKCLDGNEEILVEIDITTLTSDQIERLSKFKI